MAIPSRVTLPFVGRLIERLNLRYPTLFLLLAALTLVDFVVPDVVPLADELGLLLLTMLVGRWKSRRPATLDRDLASEGN
jgi:hypothetical protein